MRVHVLVKPVAPRIPIESFQQPRPTPKGLRLPAYAAHFRPPRAGGGAAAPRVVVRGEPTAEPNQANQFEACKYWWCKPGQGQGICLADGFYTISYDPKP